MQLNIIESIQQQSTGFNFNSLLPLQNHVYLATSTGSIVIYDNQLQLIKTIENFNNGAIDKILSIQDTLITLSNGIVSIYDLTTLQLLESLPFKQVLNISKYNDFLGISTKSLIIIYHYTQGQFEVIKQFKTMDKPLEFEFINQDSIIYGSNSQFYYYNNNQSIKLPFKSQFSIFNQISNIIPYDGIVILNKGSQILKYNYIENTSTTINLSFIPNHIISIKPFLICCTKNHIHILDSNHLSLYQTIHIPTIQQISYINNEIIIISQNKIHQFKLSSFDKIINQLTKLDQSKSIEFINQLSPSQYPEKSLKLRSLEIEIAKTQFYEQNYKFAIQKFIDFIAPPMIVLNLYPSYLTGIKSDKEQEEPQIDSQAISYLINYLSDIRRKFNKVLGSQDNTIEFLDSKLNIESFTQGTYSINEIQSSVDTALFKCYLELNSGLIGSLVRIDNYCDPDLVINTFKSKNMINELIDFYNKKSMHKQALELLFELSQDSKDPGAIVSYIQKNLKNDHLDLILEYSDWCISISESWAIEIFINSLYSETFNKFKVWKYLNTKSINLEKIYLEFIIEELDEQSKILNTRLIEIYFELLSNDTKPESIYFNKLQKSLQFQNYDFLKTLEILSKYQENNSLNLLKTFILKNLGNHKESLNILVKQLNSPHEAINYAQSLFNTDDDAQKWVLFLINLFWDYNKDKSSIMELLSKSQNSIQLIDILNTLPIDLKISEIEQVLIKNLRLQRKFYTKSLLTKNLSTLEALKIEDELFQKQSGSVEIILNETRCKQCNAFLGNSVLKKFPNNDLIHFGCLKNYEQELEFKMRSRKLKTIKLKDYKLEV
ncbi:hypothetical protein BN7_5704 [Wickerhamomyces ciferrii]|uniref:CNH domain-containing protein n=1 Tax=Wickerhamomyces ciferrii (strain ATCC 14091 / BCRC 22168 / CBS 111 / JCM 3599 / NBRC 0793 / NRRL Y-1031 F-60-10) TaxID=1206466 RepID=K0KSG4_WICCF|nr:uncharacterized protein BN7_5704 [Wickerhamomyces ciferrii]CCH46116.1 hypothetical protein BN7_5704 [Wickerhamomyces ciferrii]